MSIPILYYMIESWKSTLEKIFQVWTSLLISTDELSSMTLSCVTQTGQLMRKCSLLAQLLSLNTMSFNKICPNAPSPTIIIISQSFQRDLIFFILLFSPNTFCHNKLSTSTAKYSQFAENRVKFFINFHQRYLENTVEIIKIRPIVCE